VTEREIGSRISADSPTAPAATATTVMHVITGLEAGGAERTLFNVVTANANEGAPHQIVVSLMGDGVYGAQLRAAGVELHCLNLSRGIPTPAALLKLAKLMRTRKPDVVMTWLYHADLIGTLAAMLAGRGTSRRLIWNIRCSDLDFTRYNRMTRWVVRLLALLSRLPAAIAANSQAGIREHQRLGYRPQVWSYLPNGFDTQAWRPDAADRIMIRRELGLSSTTIAVGIVARVDPQKDYATFLAAAETLAAAQHDVRFVLIGKDTDRLTVAERLQPITLKLGHRRDIDVLLRGLDILVLSSAFGEGFPNAVGEAMASALPCIVTDVGDAGVLVGDTGVVVPPASPQMLTQALETMLSESREQRLQRGLAAQARILANFELKSAIAAYRELWESVKT
jgi:glycosyltransferase involved in cell wall biosynthesis